MNKVFHHGVAIPEYPEPKDPSANTLYGFDWSSWLQTGETISVSVWFCHPDMSIVSSDYDPSGTSVLVSGGKRQRKYVITNRITTSNGRIEDRSFRVEVRNK